LNYGVKELKELNYGVKELKELKTIAYFVRNS